MGESFRRTSRHEASCVERMGESFVRLSRVSFRMFDFKGRHSIRNLAFDYTHGANGASYSEAK